jgi:hypothetical protein
MTHESFLLLDKDTDLHVTESMSEYGSQTGVRLEFVKTVCEVEGGNGSMINSGTAIIMSREQATGLLEKLQKHLEG